jgi:hypothetical protein
VHHRRGRHRVPHRTPPPWDASDLSCNDHINPSSAPTTVDLPQAGAETPPHCGRRLGGDPPSRADAGAHRQAPLPTAVKQWTGGTPPHQARTLHYAAVDGGKVSAATILVGRPDCAGDPLRQRHSREERLEVAVARVRFRPESPRVDNFQRNLKM